VVGVRLVHEGDTVVIELDGTFLEPDGEKAFQSGYQPLLGAQARFVVDLSRLDFLDTKRLAELVVFYKRVRAAGGRVGFCSLKPVVRDTFGVTRLDKILEIYVTRLEALRALAGADPFKEPGSLKGP
jgi:anti-anti-sigma factor